MAMPRLCSEEGGQDDRRRKGAVYQAVKTESHHLIPSMAVITRRDVLFLKHIWIVEDMETSIFIEEMPATISMDKSLSHQPLNVKLS
jgi:hypothetical protein